MNRESTYLAVDELQVTRALRIAVAGTHLGTSLVAGVLSHTTIGIHLGEVEGAVETAGEVGDVDVEGELLVEELEHLVARVGLHEVETGADVLVGTAGDEVELERGPAGGDTVGTGVVRSVQSAVGGAGGGVGAQGRVPGVSGVAVGVPAVI